MAKKPTAPARQMDSPDDVIARKAADAKLAEDAAHDAACRNPAIVAAAGIRNGMPAEEQRARLLRAAGYIVSE